MLYMVSICLFIWEKWRTREASFSISRIVAIVRESWRKKGLPKWVTWEEKSGTTWQVKAALGYMGLIDEHV